MPDDICFLITLLSQGTLLRCAVKIPLDYLSSDIVTYPMEPENKKILSKYLPEDMQSCAIVEVQEIFEVTVVD